MVRNDVWDILDPILAAQRRQNAALGQGAPQAQQQAAPPMQLPPAPPAFAPRPVRYNAPKRQPLIRMGSPLQTGFWGALSLLAPQLATGYLRGRQMSQEQEQQDAMLQYKAAMDEEQQRRQASQDEWDQWGKTANVELDRRRLDQADAKAQDPRTLRSKVVSQLIQQGRGVTPDVLAWSMNPDPEATMPQLGENVEGGRLWKAIQDAIAATQRNNTGLLTLTGNAGVQYLPSQPSPVVNPNPVPITASPGGTMDTRSASAANSRASAAFTQGPKTKKTEADTAFVKGPKTRATNASAANLESLPGDRDRRYLLSLQIAEQRARTDRERIGAKRAHDQADAEKKAHQKALTVRAQYTERARKLGTTVAMIKNLDSIGFAPGSQMLESLKFYMSPAGGEVIVPKDGGFGYQINKLAKPEHIQAFYDNQGQWARGDFQFVNGRQIDARAPKPAAPKAAPKPAPANPMRKAKTAKKAPVKTGVASVDAL